MESIKNMSNRNKVISAIIIVAALIGLYTWHNQSELIRGTYQYDGEEADSVISYDDLNFNRIKFTDDNKMIFSYDGDNSTTVKSTYTKSGNTLTFSVDGVAHKATVSDDHKSITVHNTGGKDNDGAADAGDAAQLIKSK